MRRSLALALERASHRVGHPGVARSVHPRTGGRARRPRASRWRVGGHDARDIRDHGLAEHHPLDTRHDMHVHAGPDPRPERRGVIGVRGQ